MKRGRPKSPFPAKNRRHTIVLTLAAETAYRRINPHRANGWLNQYISEHIVRDFPIGKKAALMAELLALQKNRNELEEKIYNIANEIKKLKLKDAEKAVKDEIDKSLEGYSDDKEEEM